MLVEAAPIKDILDATDTSDFPDDAVVNLDDDDSEKVADADVADAAIPVEDDADENEFALEGDMVLDDAAKPGEEKPVADGRARNPDGTFAEKPKEAVVDAAVVATPVGAPVVEAAKAPEPLKWEPLAVRADKDIVPIEGAHVARADGRVVMTMPEKEYGQLQAMIGRGHVAQKVWHQLDAERKQFDAEKSAPQPRSDAEIEAVMTLEILKPYLGELLTADQVRALDAEIKLAKIEEKGTFETKRKEAIANSTRAEDDAKQEVLGIANQILTIVADVPELQQLTRGEAQEVLADLAQIKRAVYWKDGDQWMANNEVIHAALKRKLASRSAAAPAPAAGTPNTGTGAPSKEHTAAPVTDPAIARAELENKGHNTAAKPAPSTSLKNGRQTGDARPSKENTRSSRDADRSPTRSKEQTAEDDWRKTRHEVMRSNTLG